MYQLAEHKTAFHEQFVLDHVMRGEGRCHVMGGEGRQVMRGEGRHVMMGEGRHVMMGEGRQREIVELNTMCIEPSNKIYSKVCSVRVNTGFRESNMQMCAADTCITIVTSRTSLSSAGLCASTGCISLIK